MTTYAGKVLEVQVAGDGLLHFSLRVRRRLSLNNFWRYEERWFHADLRGQVFEGAGGASIAALLMAANLSGESVEVDVPMPDLPQVQEVRAKNGELRVTRKPPLDPTPYTARVIHSHQYVTIANATPLRQLLLEDPIYNELFGPLRAALNPRVAAAADFDYYQTFRGRRGLAQLSAAVYADNSANGVLALGGPNGAPPSGLLVNEFWLYDSSDPTNPADLAPLTAPRRSLHWRVRLEVPALFLGGNATPGVEYTNTLQAPNDAYQTRLDLRVFLDSP